MWGKTIPSDIIYDWCKFGIACGICCGACSNFRLLWGIWGHHSGLCSNDKTRKWCGSLFPVPSSPTLQPQKLNNTLAQNVRQRSTMIWYSPTPASKNTGYKSKSTLGCYHKKSTKIRPQKHCQIETYGFILKQNWVPQVMGPSGINPVSHHKGRQPRQSRNCRFLEAVFSQNRRPVLSMSRRRPCQSLSFHMCETWEKLTKHFFQSSLLFSL